METPPAAIAAAASQSAWLNCEQWVIQYDGQ
jgi:hypothetical protein